MRAALALLAVVLLPAATGARGAVDLTGSTTVLMQGTLVRDEASANEVGWGGISFGFTGQARETIRWFGVVYAALGASNSFDAKSAILRGQHYTPTLTVTGPRDQLEQLLALPDGTRVELKGLLVTRTRNLLLDVVKPLPGAGGR